MEIELVNGSWSQTFAYILQDINNKLKDREIEDIIRRIDDKISDEEIIQLCNYIIGKIKSLEINDVTILNKLDSIFSRVNSISVIREIKVYKEKCKVEPRKRFRRVEKVEPYHYICNDDITYIIDMDIYEGYTEPYKVYLDECVFTYDWRLFWLVNGNKRRLMYKGELKDDMIRVYNKYGIYDIDIIKKSEASLYDNRAIK